MSEVTPKGRKTLYKGVEFKSRLEADFAGWLDRRKLPWTYEPRAYQAERAGDHVQYLPDFEVTEIAEGTGRPDGMANILIEVKPTTFPLADDEGRAKLYPLLARMAIVWDEEPDRDLRLVLWPYGGDWPEVMVGARGHDHVWHLRHVLLPGMHLILPGLGQWAAVADRHLGVIRQAGG